MTTNSEQLDLNVLGLATTEVGQLRDLPFVPEQDQASIIGTVISALEEAGRHERTFGYIGKVAQITDGLKDATIMSGIVGNNTLAAKLSGLLGVANDRRSVVPHNLDAESYALAKVAEDTLGQDGRSYTRADAPEDIYTPNGLPLTWKRVIGNTALVELTPAAGPALRAFERRQALDSPADN